MANKIVREIIHAKGIDIGIYTKDFENEYISLTDIAKYRNDNDPRFVIQNWMRNRNTVEFLAVWEELHNPDFNRVQFEAVRSGRIIKVCYPKQPKTQLYFCFASSSE